jgi:hypothetical protein
MKHESDGNLEKLNLFHYVDGKQYLWGQKLDMAEVNLLRLLKFVGMGFL